MHQKYRKLLLTISIIFLGIISIACTNQTENKKTSETNEAQTYTKKWQKGVPSKYNGYYGTRTSAMGDDNLFSPVTFTSKQVTYGLGDTMIFDDVEYRQLDKNTYVIHGTDNHYDSEHPDVYLKVAFKTSKGKMYLGIISDKSNSTNPAIDSLSKTIKLDTKNVTWYQRYSKSQFDKLTNGGSGNESDSTNDSDSQSSSNNNSGSEDGTPIEDSSYNGKLYRMPGPPLFLSFNAEMDNDGDPLFSAYNVHDNGSPYQSAFISNPTITTKGNKIIISPESPDATSFPDADSNGDVVLEKISDTKIKRGNDVYVLFNGNFQQLNDTINNELGLPIDGF